MKAFSKETRNKNLERFQNEEFDLFIIGGGINGAGVARDAASRGLKVGLAEKNDFASGTSSRSSKLIHGGIRYLENLEFHLVFEALNERSKLFKMAPHLVHPLEFLIPLYKDSRVGMFTMSLGMWIYDLLALLKAPELHKRFNVEKLVENYPLLQKENLWGGFSYYDAYMDDDRLTIETLRSANEFGAAVVNYVEVSEIKNGVITLNDKINSQKGHSQKIQVKARHIVSAVGPWTDVLGAQIFPNWTPWLRPTKGIHLTFERSRIPLKTAVVMATAKDQRIVFAIPRHEMVIIGTTDTDYTGSLEDIRAEEDEIEYLLSVANHYFPGAALVKKDILATYAGVRPLVKDESSTEGKTSREHRIKTYKHENCPITFVSGGKYTTYRRMAEQVVEEVLRYFPIEKRIDFLRNDTTQPLNPQIDEDSYPVSKEILKDWSLRFGLTQADVEGLAQRYGRETECLLKEAPKEFSALQKEAYFCAQKTMCLFREDFIRLRTPLALSAPQTAAAADLTAIFSKSFFELKSKG